MSASIEQRLRPYQIEIARAVLDSVLNKQGLTFTVEIARQGGKNELSAQLELLLLTLNMHKSKNLVKCSPTFKPQTVISMLRLKEKLDAAGFAGIWTAEMGYIIRLGDARAIFLSAEESASVVGNTAHLLLEVDEAQDVNRDKYSKEFKPMGSTTNVTTVLYGTTWDDTTLLEEIKQKNLELERKDSIRRHFRYDWQEIAKYNTDYLAYVEGERQRLGENHPLFMTQYRLLPVTGGGRFLSPQQRVQLQGEHSRLHAPAPGKVYIAGLDLAGEAETNTLDILKNASPQQDSTVLTIAEIEPPRGQQSCARIVEHCAWKGIRHPDLYARLVDILKNIWKCRLVAVDATGIGQPVASFLRESLGSRILPITFTTASKSKLGFNLLAFINAGRLKMYAADGSIESAEFWLEMEKARSQFRASQTLNFYVDPAEGHDDYLMSLALTAEALEQYSPRQAQGKIYE